MRKRSNLKNKKAKVNTIRKYLHSSMTKEKNNEKACAAFNTPPYQKRALAPKDKIMNSIVDVDMSDLKLPVITVYKHPEDYPESYVARIYDIDIPTDTIIIKDTLGEIQEDIREHTGKVFLKREKDDAPEIVGTWL